MRREVESDFLQPPSLMKATSASRPLRHLGRCRPTARHVRRGQVAIDTAEARALEKSRRDGIKEKGGGGRVSKRREGVRWDGGGFLCIITLIVGVV